jgi:hypothetical protein
LVFAFTTEAIDVEAEVMVPAVEATPFVTAVPREVEAVRIEEFVFAFTSVVTFEIELPSDEEAVVTSDCKARAPVERVPSVKFLVPYVQTSEAVSVEPRLVSVRVPFVHTSAARVPNVVRDRVVALHTEVGIVARSEVEAVSTVELVLVLIVVIAEAT